MDGGLTKQTNKQTNTIAGLVDVPTAAMVGVSTPSIVVVPTAAMVGVSTNHHCRQLIVKKVVGGDTDHGLVTPTTAS
ncbi:hypothetical protein [Sphingobacterium daejeonense]|uniref:hypothetical protein n=1 Tax=Sphingobacterium daejeonense TaxID=371142 RepID=UPI0010C46662|nr:hypothetical protein [Sphingobacterium daejeonense]VTP96569.1 Uncharacterised protein [Sphingobacterium daejeonense]